MDLRIKKGPEMYYNPAQKMYPDLDPEVAVQQYVLQYWEKHVWFMQEGERRVIRSTIRSYYNMRDESAEYDSSGRKFLVEPKNEKDLQKRIFVPKDKCKIAQIIGKHKSETGIGWRLPRDHPRHLLNFPQDIFNIIFGFMLVVNKTRLITPDAVTCNWKRFFMPRPGYLTTDLEGHDDYSMMIDEYCSHPIYIPKHDRYGSFTEIRSMPRRELDSVCLQVCSQLWAVGRDMLYGQNIFKFKMRTKGKRDCPPSWIDGKPYKPSAAKPGPNSQWRRGVKHAISQVRNQVDAKQLWGWIYYDMFLRFLHSIGPRNSAKLKTLKFEGVVQTHVCRGCYCTDDLVHNIRIYVPFIKRLCPNLEKLILLADVDCRISQDVEPVEALKRFEASLKPLLEKDLRQIDSLRVLVVERRKGREEDFSYGSDYNSNSGSDSENRISVDFAQETIDWLKVRGARKLLPQIAKIKN